MSIPILERIEEREKGNVLKREELGRRDRERMRQKGTEHKVKSYFNFQQKATIHSTIFGMHIRGSHSDPLGRK